MSWFDIFAGHVIFGSARVCDLAPAALDWQITANVPVYFETFSDSNCVVQPSQVWTSWACLSKTTSRESWNQGCDPNKTPIGFDFKFQQHYNAGLDLNFTVTTTVDCTKATVFHDGTGLNFLYECDSSGAKCKDACGPRSSSTSSLSTTKTTSSSRSSSRSSSTVSCSSASTSSASSSTITKSSSTITVSCPSESTQPRTSTPPVTSTSSTTVTQPPKTTSNPPRTTSNPPKTMSNPPTTTFNPPKNTTSSNPPVSSRPVTAGSSNLHAPRTLLWTVLLFFLCLFTPDVLGFISPAAAEPLPAVPRSPLDPRTPLTKRLSPTKISDLQAMLSPAFATIEHNLPAKPGAPASNALRATANSLVASMCAAGKTQRQLYGADWIAKGNLSKPGNAKPDPAVDAPYTRPLTQLMALCVRAVDGMDAGLGAFYTQQQLLDNSAWPSGPTGVLYMKFVGVLYCNRLVVALQQGGDAELDGICGLRF